MATHSDPGRNPRPDWDKQKGLGHFTQSGGCDTQGVLSREPYVTLIPCTYIFPVSSYHNFGKGGPPVSQIRKLGWDKVRSECWEQTTQPPDSIVGKVPTCRTSFILLS